MRAVILVGGFGTRLRPLTLTRPKQLLPMGHVTMIERVVTALGAHGVTEAVLSLGYRPDGFREQFPDGECAGVRLRYAEESEPLDTAGAIRFAATEAGIDERFIVVNGDVITTLDVAGLWRRHEEFGGLATIALTPVEDPSRYGVVPIDGKGRVEAFIEKPPRDEAPSNWINAGTYILEPEVVEHIPDGPVSVERVVFPALVTQRELFAVHSEAYWIDAGTPSAYLQAHLDLLDGALGEKEAGVHPTAVVDGAEVDHTWVGEGAVIGAGAVVRDAVVMAGARVAPGARIERAIIGAGARIGAGATVTGEAVVGDGAAVEDGGLMDGGTEPPASSWS